MCVCIVVVKSGKLLLLKIKNCKTYSHKKILKDQNNECCENWDCSFEKDNFLVQKIFSM